MTSNVASSLLGVPHLQVPCFYESSFTSLNPFKGQFGGFSSYRNSTMKPVCSHSSVSSKLLTLKNRAIRLPYGCFLKWWYPTSFLLKTIILGCFGGTTISETPIFVETPTHPPKSNYKITVWDLTFLCWGKVSLLSNLTVRKGCVFILSLQMVAPLKIQLERKSGGLVQMIFRISIGWCLASSRSFSGA